MGAGEELDEPPHRGGLEGREGALPTDGCGGWSTGGAQCSLAAGRRHKAMLHIKRKTLLISIKN